MERIPGILNGALARSIVELGHGDLLVICDAGFPVPPRAQLIDLALLPGVPSFVDVLDAVYQRCEVEGILIATELEYANGLISKHVLETCLDVPIRSESHEDFKKAVATARLVVRTGECTPYANIGLFGGVSFGGEEV
jgi:D-ribose pyranase